MPKLRPWIRVTLIVASVLVVLAGAALIYYLGSSMPTEQALEAFEEARSFDGYYCIGDTSSACALILYPGGRVDYRAYAPLARELSLSGELLCIVPKLPLNLAVLAPDTALELMEDFPAVERWFIGGHSLGGAMAASLAAEHGELFSGVFLLAAYSTAELGLPTISIYGDKDGVLNMEKYEQYSENLPANFTELIISGGNHAGFGDYGAQDGDGIAVIDGDEQRRQAVTAVVEWTKKIN